MNNNFENENNIKYTDLVKENIYIAKQLYSIPKEKQDLVKKLLLKKKNIQLENGFLAELRIDIINKKINKIKEECNGKEKK